MNAIKIDRLRLLAIVRENMLNHAIEYGDSVSEYKALVLQVCNANAALAATGSFSEFAKIKSMPATPVSYDSSYKRAIRMLELSVEATIEVEENVFNQLVLDEWDWKRSFTANTMSYKVGNGY